MEGAAGLAAFAEGLSEAEWNAPVSRTDRRSVGVIVHHVASVYPIEIDLARTISSGTAVPEVTWEVVAQLNRAAPFSRSFGAAVTAQFVIEDHALRHGWHHLARIRTALGQ